MLQALPKRTKAPSRVTFVIKKLFLKANIQRLNANESLIKSGLTSFWSVFKRLKLNETSLPDGLSVLCRTYLQAAFEWYVEN